MTRSLNQISKVTNFSACYILLQSFSDDDSPKFDFDLHKINDFLSSGSPSNVSTDACDENLMLDSAIERSPKKCSKRQ
jgi:hypothetical protein